MGGEATGLAKTLPGPTVCWHLGYSLLAPLSPHLQKTRRGFKVRTEDHF